MYDPGVPPHGYFVDGRYDLRVTEARGRLGGGAR